MVKLKSFSLSKISQIIASILQKNVSFADRQKDGKRWAKSSLDLKPVTSYEVQAHLVTNHKITESLKMSNKFTELQGQGHQDQGATSSGEMSAVRLYGLCVRQCDQQAVCVTMWSASCVICVWLCDQQTLWSAGRPNSPGEVSLTLQLHRSYATFDPLPSLYLRSIITDWSCSLPWSPTESIITWQTASHVWSPLFSTSSACQVLPQLWCEKVATSRE